MQVSPAYRRYIERLPEDTRNDPNRLSAAAFSTDAYLAAEGQRSTVYDPTNPLPTTDISQVNPVDLLSGGGQQPYTPKSREQSLADSMQRYQTDMALFDQMLQGLTGNPNASLDSLNGMNPMLRSAWIANLQAAGVSVPSMPSDVAAYLQWSATVPPGGDSSIAAFFRYQDQFLRGVSLPDGQMTVSQ